MILPKIQETARMVEVMLSKTPVRKISHEENLSSIDEEFINNKLFRKASPIDQIELFNIIIEKLNFLKNKFRIVPEKNYFRIDLDEECFYRHSIILFFENSSLIFKAMNLNIEYKFKKEFVFTRGNAFGIYDPEKNIIKIPKKK